MLKGDCCSVEDCCCDDERSDGGNSSALYRLQRGVREAITDSHFSLMFEVREHHNSHESLLSCVPGTCGAYTGGRASPVVSMSDIIEY